MTPQVLKPGDIIKCHDMEDLEVYARTLETAGYHITRNVIVSEKDGDKHWIEIVDPDQVLPFPNREENENEKKRNSCPGGSSGAFCGTARFCGRLAERQ